MGVPKLTGVFQKGRETQIGGYYLVLLTEYLVLRQEYLGVPNITSVFRRGYSPTIEKNAYY